MHVKGVHVGYGGSSNGSHVTSTPVKMACNSKHNAVMGKTKSCTCACRTKKNSGTRKKKQQCHGFVVRSYNVQFSGVPQQSVVESRT